MKKDTEIIASIGMINKYTNKSFYYICQVGEGKGGWGLTSVDEFGGDNPAFFKLIFTWWVLKIGGFVEVNTWYNMYPKTKIAEIKKLDYL